MTTFVNCYYWVDPVKKVTGAVFTQLLPFYDQRMVELFGAFERGVYSAYSVHSGLVKG